MSDYYRSLDVSAGARYVAKLQLLELDEGGDPYATHNAEKFTDDMSLWPALEYGHIFCYFIDRPGVYTKQQLLQWKSLEAYNYFMSGHVRTVLLWAVNATSCIVKALVNPSQRSPDSAHHAWVAMKKDGQIMAAHCTCMAGSVWLTVVIHEALCLPSYSLGEGCSHVAATLFKIEAAVRNGYTSCTSNLCRWNQVFTKKVRSPSSMTVLCVWALE